MKIINSNFEIITTTDETNYNNVIKHIEYIARHCYKSESSIAHDTGEVFIRRLIKNGHEAMIEHHVETVKFIIDRGIANELVRHRIASFAQESTRYCRYTDDKFGNQITVVDPSAHFKNIGSYDIWKEAMKKAEETYNLLISMGESPQMARSVLPTSLKTELVVTANLREWRTIFKLRGAQAAHPQMREVIIPLIQDFKSNLPVFFEDILI